MSKPLFTLTPLVAALLLAAAGPVGASSHREAPSIAASTSGWPCPRQDTAAPPEASR